MQFLTFILASLVTIASPDGNLKVNLNSGNNGAITYSISLGDKQMIAPSKLGLVTNESAYTSLQFLGEETSTIDVTYTMTRTKRSHVDHKATRTVLHFSNPDGRHMDMEWHVSDNDAAFRYIILKDTVTGSVRVTEEQSFFKFPEGTTTYLCPQSDAMVGWKRSKPSYEEYYKLADQLGSKSEFGHGYTFPCLFNVNGGWVLISETGVDSRYAASHLSDYDPAEGYCIAFPMMEENNGNGTVDPAFALPGATPWRTMTFGSTLAPIAETTIAFDLVKPLYRSTHTYDYGKSTWSWIVWQDDSCNYDDQKTFIDLAADLGWKYTLVDAGWDQMIGRDKVEELSFYAQSKGTNLFMWYSSSGWWNDIVQSPVDIMSNPITRKAEMRWLQSIGVKGIKVDFFGGDKQETMRLYESILSDADDHGLMVIFHGCTIPRGWERMYPNYVGSEAVRASENLVFNQSDCDIEALNACLHPFIRNTIGSMEFGGTFLNKRLSRSNTRGSIRRTTDNFQLATAVLFQNAIQNFALTPNNLTDAPAYAINFMKSVPTTWDDIRFIDGMPGEYAVIARRSGLTWYVGAINATDKPLKLDIKELTGKLGGVSAEVVGGADTKKPLSIPKNDGAVIIVR